MGEIERIATDAQRALPVREVSVHSLLRAGLHGERNGCSRPRVGAHGLCLVGRHGRILNRLVVLAARDASMAELAGA
jgi:hypothetical protein